MAEDAHKHCAGGQVERPWYIIDIALLGGFSLAYAACWVVVYVSMYLRGFQREPPLGLAISLAGTALLTLLLLIIAIRRIVHIWGGHLHDGHRLLRVRLLVVTGVTLCLALPFTPLGLPRHRVFMAGFKKFVKTNVDLDSVRAWLRTVDPNSCPEYVHDLASGATIESWWPDAAEWARTITSANPHSAALSLDGNGHPVIRIKWFGVPDHWGLTVGDRSMPTPPSGYSRRNEVAETIAPGAYVWREIR